MSVVETTYGQQEGVDTMRAFLLKHRSVLKKGLDAVYDILQENEIEEYDELIKFSETDLRSILDPNINDTKIKIVHIGKLINILRDIPQSTIYKASNKEKIVIVLSDEEYNALNSIRDKTEEMKQYKQEITGTLSQLNKNRIQSKAEIDKQTTLIIQAAQQKQAELTIKLDNIIKDKTKKLTKQLLALQNEESAVNKCYSKCQELVNDTTLNSIKRKQKILTNIKLLSDKNIASYDTFKAIESAHIATNINIDNVLNAVRVCGDVTGYNKALPPVVTIKNVTSHSVEVNMETGEENIIGYRLSYAECNGNKMDLDDMKLQWINVDVNESKCNITALQPLTNYLLHGCCKNNNGFGCQSKAIALKTAKPSFVFNVCTKGMNHVIQNSGKSFISTTSLISRHINAGCSIGMKAGICELGIWSKQSSGGFGITSDIGNCTSNKYMFSYPNGKTYYLSNGGNAHIAGSNGTFFRSRKWKKRDIVKMEWGKGTVNFYINNIKIGTMNIIAGVIYYPCVSVKKKSVEYEIVST